MRTIAVFPMILGVVAVSMAENIYWTGEGNRWGGTDVAWSSVDYGDPSYPAYVSTSEAVNNGQSWDFVYDATAMSGTINVVRMNRNSVTSLSVTLNGAGQGGFEFTNTDGNGDGLALAGPITVLGGMHQFSPPTAGRSITLTADSTWDIAADSGLLFGNILSGGFGLTKTGPGALAFTGDQTYIGDTVISVGAFGVYGGNASLAGNLGFASGAKLLFDGTYTLTVAGNVTFGSLGIADLVGLDASVGEGTYDLISGNVDFSNIGNVGLANAVDIGGGKMAYFQQGSLQLVVVPEPSSIALAGLGIAGLLIFRRRMRD